MRACGAPGSRSCGTPTTTSAPSRAAAKRGTGTAAGAASSATSSRRCGRAHGASRHDDERAPRAGLPRTGRRARRRGRELPRAGGPAASAQAPPRCRDRHHGGRRARTRPASRMSFGGDARTRCWSATTACASSHRRRPETAQRAPLHVRRAVEIEELIPVESEFDIGLAPLRDTAFNRARSNVKLKEYAAAGAMWLASPVGPYVGMGEEQGGLLVGDGDWLADARSAADDADRRRALAAGRAAWAQSQTIRAGAARWQAAYRDAVERARAAAERRGARAARSPRVDHRAPPPGGRIRRRDRRRVERLHEPRARVGRVDHVVELEVGRRVERGAVARARPRRGPSRAARAPPRPRSRPARRAARAAPRPRRPSRPTRRSATRA